MAPPVRNAKASVLNRLTFGLLYFALLAAWNWLCSQHYSAHAQSQAIRAEKTVKSPSVLPKADAPLKIQLPTVQRAVPAPVEEPPRVASKSLPHTASAAASTAAETSTAAASSSSAAAASASCPKRSPYHTLLTTQASIYQQWQSRIMYFHWAKQRALDGPCTDMTGFTRLVASEGGKADGLEGEMPSVFVPQYEQSEMAKYGHFGVLNRPYSVVQFIESGGYAAIKEAFVYIAETDHVLMKPLPNLATADKAAAFAFGYMHAGMMHQSLISRFAPGVSYTQVQPVGPSPLIIAKSTMQSLAPAWLNMSLRLKLDKDADNRFGWVLEMWGYSIAAAQAGVTHEVLHNFQVEGGAGISARSAKQRGTYIFHYTYGLEYTMGGRPQGVNQIGEWSLDKRHYGGAYPPRNMQPPPKGASDGAYWLLGSWNEASANIAAWPATKAIGTVGWRRVAGDGIGGSEVARKMLRTKWTWAGIPGLEFNDGGALKTPWGKGVWGVLPSGVDYNDEGFCKVGCLFADFGSALHNVKVDTSATPWTFDTYRVGDGAHVPGVRKDA